MTDAAPSTTAPDGVHPDPAVVDDTSQLTPQWFDTVLGTAGYMAPEQVRQQAVDHRADIFVFGAVLHEMLTGRRAFASDTVLGTAGTASTVRSVTTEPVGTGQMAATVRAHLDLGEGSRRTVVVKYGRADVESTMAAMAYAKEVARSGVLRTKVRNWPGRNGGKASPSTGCR